MQKAAGPPQTLVRVRLSVYCAQLIPAQLCLSDGNRGEVLAHPTSDPS